MKKNWQALLLLTAACMMNSCLKDSATRHYSYQVPIYKTSDEVRASVSLGAPQAIGKPGQISILGNFIYLNELEKGVHVIDNSDPASPKNIGFINIPGNEQLAIRGNTLYADCYIDLFAIDISDPHRAVLTGTVDNLFTQRNYINGFVVQPAKFIAGWVTRDTVVSISQQAGSNPGGINFFASANSTATGSGDAASTGGSTSKFAIQGRYLYAVNPNQLVTCDLSIASSPKLSATTALGMHGASLETVYPFQQNLFIGSTSGTYICTLGDPAHPALAGSFDHASVCDPVIADEKYAYVTMRSGAGHCGGKINELDVLDVSNVRNPLLRRTYPMSGPEGLSRDRGLLFVCDGSLKIYDASVPEDLKLLSTVAMSAPHDVICLDGRALLVADAGIYQYDYSNPTNLKLLSVLPVNTN